jgi:hypothetical protein
MIVAFCWGVGILYLLAYSGVAAEFSALSELYGISMNTRSGRYLRSILRNLA